jgi:hypothetical protein
MTWDDEVVLLKRELSRAHASLRMEEQRNRGLPPMTAIATPEEFERRGQQAVTKFMAFLAAKDFMPIKPNMDPALRRQIGKFVPESTRNFFEIASHYEPLTLYTHFYHWWDLAQMRDEPHASPLRRGPLLCQHLGQSRRRGWRPQWRSSCCTPGCSTMSPVRARSSGSCSPSVPRVVSARCMHRRTN